jgi:hypothetical protein
MAVFFSMLLLLLSHDSRQERDCKCYVLVTIVPER